MSTCVTWVTLMSESCKRLQLPFTDLNMRINSSFFNLWNHVYLCYLGHRMSEFDQLTFGNPRLMQQVSCVCRHHDMGRAYTGGQRVHPITSTFPHLPSVLRGGCIFYVLGLHCGQRSEQWSSLGKSGKHQEHNTAHTYC